MSIEGIQAEAEKLTKEYPYCNGGIFLDATGRDRPDFIGGNCYEHAHKLAAVVGGRVISTPLDSDRIHAAFFYEDGGQRLFCDTSMNLSRPFEVGREFEHRLPFDSRRTPSWFKARNLEGDQMEFSVCQPYFPHGAVRRYMVDFSNGCTEFFMHRVLRAQKKNINLIAQDDDGMVQLQVSVDGRAQISGRESTEWGPAMRRPGHEQPLIDRMGGCLDVSAAEVRDVLEACASAYRRWHQLD